MATGIVVGLGGSIAAGKSAVARYLRDSYDFTVLSYSRFLARRLGQRGVLVNRDSLQAMGLELGSTLGYDGLTRLLMENTDAGKHYAVDGVRHRTALDYLRKRYKQRFAFIFRDVDRMTRWQSCCERRQEQRPPTFEEFCTIEASSVEAMAEALKDAADLVLPYLPQVACVHARVDAFLLAHFGLKPRSQGRADGSRVESRT